MNPPAKRSVFVGDLETLRGWGAQLLFVTNTTKSGPTMLVTQRGHAVSPRSCQNDGANHTTMILPAMKPSWLGPPKPCVMSQLAPPPSHVMAQDQR